MLDPEVSVPPALLSVTAARQEQFHEESFVLTSEDGFIDTEGEVLSETSSPSEGGGPPDVEDPRITAIASSGVLRAWGPPIVLGVIVLGAFWWLRK